MLTEAAIVGEWLLVSWQIRYPARAALTRPFGEEAEGLLIYTGSGWMSAVTKRRDRTGFASDDMRRIDPRAKAAAFDSYLHYAGRWRIVGTDIQHEVLFSLNPLLEGTLQVRSATLADQVLALEARETLAPSEELRIHRLVWRAARAGGLY